MLSGYALRGFAQQPAPWVDPQVSALYIHISQRAQHLEPMLEQVRVRDWIAKGASETYLAQFVSIRQQIQAIETEMTGLALHPDRLQESMGGLFRVQSLHHSLGSILGGLRTFQNPALADLIQSVADEDQADLQALQNHIMELASAQEQELQVVNREAQRCRASLSKQPAINKPK